MTSVVCEDFENFQSSPVCALWFVDTLNFFSKTPLCVGPVLCEDFEFVIKNSPVCVGPVVCGDFDFFFKNSPVRRPCGV